ncbi:MAG: alpha/beta hydrolase [Deltaproteobacteria bacterium]|jgi:pimeloyl-ACP methyl ester carboxylesterase|nr:alpha/beta hydrolase [Deltaproteobacteria bacterium]
MKPFRNITLACMLLMLLFSFGCSSKKEAGVLKSVNSLDGTRISYELYSGKEPTLIFIHGWSCDGSYWKEQIPYFSKEYQVAAIDLAGHGRSGLKRKIYSIDSFADDVKAVVDSIGASKVILIGHSMGGELAVKAANLLPKRVIGVVVVDSIQDVAYPLTSEGFARMVEPFKEDFNKATKYFLKDMFVPSTSPKLIAWITEDMSSSPPHVGISAMEEFMGEYQKGRITGYFTNINVPIFSINSKLYPTNIKSNKKYIKNYNVTFIEDAGHFPMLEKPIAFNKALDQIVSGWVQSSVNSH